MEFKWLKVNLAVLALCLAGMGTANALILSAPPRETAEAGRALYGPIAQHISEVTGVSVTYEHPGNWLNYQRNMREGKYDIVFDGPHFISWRIAHLEHEVIARLPGSLQFHLVGRKTDDKYNKPDDLIGRNICGISPPNLSTLSVLDHFRNPVRQPVIKGIKGGMKKVYSVFAKEPVCDAAVLRTAFYKRKLKDEDRERLKILFTSKSMPNQGISVSKRVDARLRKEIQKSLTIGNGVGVTKGILKRFGGKAKSFIPTENQEYAGFNQLLEGVIFGW